jgi:hypothetical protein
VAADLLLYCAESFCYSWTELMLLSGELLLFLWRATIINILWRVLLLLWRAAGTPVVRCCYSCGKLLFFCGELLIVDHYLLLPWKAAAAPW